MSRPSGRRTCVRSEAGARKCFGVDEVVDLRFELLEQLVALGGRDVTVLDRLIEPLLR